MKKIVTILSAALLLLAGTNAFAQMSVGAGYVNSTNSLKFSKNGDASTTAINGFYAGVGYTIPISRKYIEKLRVYVSGSDVWEHSDMLKVFDPESGNNVGRNYYPFFRTWAFGVNITL